MSKHAKHIVTRFYFTVISEQFPDGKLIGIPASTRDAARNILARNYPKASILDAEEPVRNSFIPDTKELFDENY